MSKTEKIVWWAVGIIVAIGIISAVTPFGRATWNTWFYGVQKVDDATSYSTKKMVEDTCRSYISTYESAVASYNVYKDSADEEKQEWAEYYRVRANNTAVSYNEYILKNSFVWKGNVPDDIRTELPLI